MTWKIYSSYTDEDLLHEGLKPEPEVWEDGLLADTSPGCFEWWYFDAHFMDGSTAVIVFFTKPIKLIRAFNNLGFNFGKVFGIF